MFFHIKSLLFPTGPELGKVSGECISNFSGDGGRGSGGITMVRVTAAKALEGATEFRRLLIMLGNKSSKEVLSMSGL